jgi:hypothetical protein
MNEMWIGRDGRIRLEGKKKRRREIDQKRRNYRRWIGMRRTEEEYSIR